MSPTFDSDHSRPAEPYTTLPGVLLSIDFHGPQPGSVKEGCQIPVSCSVTFFGHPLGKNPNRGHTTFVTTAPYDSDKTDPSARALCPLNSYARATRQGKDPIEQMIVFDRSDQDNTRRLFQQTTSAQKAIKRLGSIAASSHPSVDLDRLSDKEMRLASQSDTPGVTHCTLPHFPTCWR